jgi:pantoate--beta-alanine ligase
MLTTSLSYQDAGLTIGFVPTMGALHEGHLSLVRKAKKSADIVVVSIFVNPTQFNNSTDLEKYPRTMEADEKLLLNEGIDVLFFPTVTEIYPSKEIKSYSLDGLDKLMEGPNRPGHFNGVVQVVCRLFDIVKPQVAIFGEKDFQQLAIIRHMTSKLGYNIQVVGMATIREKNGLAMSSRNVRLSPSGRETASQISVALHRMRNQISSGTTPSTAIQEAANHLNKLEGVHVEYLEMVDPYTLEQVDDNAESIQACVAAHVEGVRLIDNMRVK